MSSVKNISSKFNTKRCLIRQNNCKHTCGSAGPFYNENTCLIKMNLRPSWNNAEVHSKEILSYLCVSLMYTNRETGLSKHMCNMHSQHAFTPQQAQSSRPPSVSLPLRIIQGQTFLILHAHQPHQDNVNYLCRRVLVQINGPNCACN